MRRTRGPRGVLFDIDDTLVDTRGAFDAAVRAVAARFLPGVAGPRLGEVVAAWRRDDGGHFRAYTRGELGFREQRRRRAAALQRSFGGADLDDAAFEAWEALFEEVFAASWRAHPDASGAVAAALDRGLSVGALSNHQVAYQRDKLRRVGLAVVPVLVGVDTLGLGKPHPEVFHEACRRLGTEPGETLYVGDELDVDAIGATRAGLLGVWLDRPEARRGGAFLEDAAAAAAAGVPVVRSLGALVNLVDAS